MKQCRHLNGLLNEEFITSSGHWFRDGEITVHNNDPDGHYTGRFWIECKDCKNTFIFTDPDKAPKWARRLYYLATGNEEK